MKNTDLTIVIPAAIAALPALSLSEKVTLAHIHEFPGCLNPKLAKLLGISVRGIEQMLRRLRERGLIQQIGKGRARVHRLLFPVERHTKCGHTSRSECAPESHTECGGLKRSVRATPAQDIAPVSEAVQAPWSRKPNADIQAIRRFLIAKGILIVGQPSHAEG